ncbi:unnamed protein product [Pieris macdunnoughi]|uniref:Uncharacterized protein n=1 Tax=Pieris macdunnoughi TaxID=345717 RepID=A0A821YB05_9NEOP|nr:unnamed protein product [Pieris macdunnoughi]
MEGSGEYGKRTVCLSLRLKKRYNTSSPNVTQVTEPCPPVVSPRPAPVPCITGGCQSSADLVLNQVTNKLVSAMSTIPVSSTSIYISNFDPSFNDFDIGVRR